MAHQIFRPGATALISGGASGVGFAMAKVCRGAGMNVALIDRNEEHLRSAKQHLTAMSANSKHPNVKTETYKLDVGDAYAWQDFKPRFEATFEHLDVLMLNAGTSVKPQTDQTYEDLDYFHKTLQTNMFGVINGLATFLPSVQACSKLGHRTAIIITGSKQGITNPPGGNNPAYNMSKSALKSLAEHLAYDLRTSGTASYTPNASVHLLIPGWTYTGLSGNAGPMPSEEVLAKKNPGAWLPEQVAEYAVKKISEGKFYIICPDNDVDESLDNARMTWQMGDVTEGRPALSRWHDETKDQAADWIQKEADKRRKAAH